jgi:purine-nucleoside phosphorylase
VDGVKSPTVIRPAFPHAGASATIQPVLGNLEGVRVVVFGRTRSITGAGAVMRCAYLEVPANSGADTMIDECRIAARGYANRITLCACPTTSNLPSQPVDYEPTDARFVPMKDAHDPDTHAALRAVKQS